MDQPDTKIGLHAAAKLLGVTPNWITRRIRAGTFPAPEYSLAGSPRFLESEVRELMASRKQAPQKTHRHLLGEEPLVTQTRAAQICKVSLPKLLGWRRAGRFPEPKVAAGSRLLFSEREVTEFSRKMLGALRTLASENPEVPIRNSGIDFFSRNRTVAT